MSKKYLFKINYSEITEDNISMAFKLREARHDNSTCTKPSNGMVYFGDGCSWQGRYIPESWFTEIKGPLTIQEAYHEFRETDLFHHTKMCYEVFDHIWELAVKDYKLALDQSKTDELNELKDQKGLS